MYAIVAFAFIQFFDLIPKTIVEDPLNVTQPPASTQEQIDQNTAPPSKTNPDGSLTEYGRTGELPDDPEDLSSIGSSETGTWCLHTGG